MIVEVFWTVVCGSLVLVIIGVMCWAIVTRIEIHEPGEGPR